MNLQTVIGIETHIELKTQNKVFCNCKALFGEKPSVNSCAVCRGEGAKPKLNQQVVDYAIKAGLALNCKINLISSFDRKHYNYHDLPKGYQITQYFTPICQDGFVLLDSGKKITVNRIHIEEDTCKTIYTDNGQPLIDYNRSGIPLIEVVTAPELSSADEAGEFVEKLQSIIRYTGVSDCKMNEGSMRCDINLSLKGEKNGDRVEIKNLNGISNIKRAIKSECQRQAELLCKGESVLKQTLKFDEKSGKCLPMRNKEDSSDYAYSPEPDLQPLVIKQSRVDKLGLEIGELPHKIYSRFISVYGLPEQTVKNLCKYKKVAEYFDKTVGLGANAKTVAKLITGTVYAYLSTEEEKQNFKIKATPEQMVKLSKMVDGGYLFNNAQKVLQKLLNGEGAELLEQNLTPLTKEELMELCIQAVQLNSQAIEKYKGGNCKAINALFGYVVSTGSGRADLSQAKKIIMELINQ